MNNQRVILLCKVLLVSACTSITQLEKRPSIQMLRSTRDAIDMTIVGGADQGILKHTCANWTAFGMDNMGIALRRTVEVVLIFI